MNRAEIIAKLRQPRYFVPLGLGALAIVAAFAALAVFYAGYAIGRYEVGPFTAAEKGEYKIFGTRFRRAGKEADAAGWPETTKRLSSIFFDMDVEIARLDLEGQGSGGGMTRFGDTALLVTQAGDIFAIRGSDDIQPTNITAPDNGFRDYVEASEGPLKEYTHTLLYLRYNDILYFESDEMRGLALSYTEFDKENLCYRNTVAMLPLEDAAAAAEDISASADDWRIIFRAEPCLEPLVGTRMLPGHMAGGRMAFRAPDTLYLASGEYARDGVYAPQVSQDPDNNYGKVVAIDLASGDARNVSMGHRNTQGITIAPDGKLWVAEHGKRGGDELNIIEEGVNYGWPFETFGTLYSGLPMPDTLSYGRHETHRAPVYAWLPSIAISSLDVVDGFHEAWDGDLLMGSLNSQNLYRIRIKDDRVMFAEEISVGQRIRYALQHNDGRIILWTDDHYVAFLTPAKADATQTFINDYIAALPLDDAKRKQLSAAVADCQMCHSFRPDDHRGAPALGRIAGAPVAGTSWAGYSAALSNKGGVWSEDALVAYIDDPAAFAPGTIMPDPGLDDPELQVEMAKPIRAIANNIE